MSTNLLNFARIDFAHKSPTLSPVEYTVLVLLSEPPHPPMSTNVLNFARIDFARIDFAHKSPTLSPIEYTVLVLLSGPHTLP